jgi:phi LC3 family holin
MKINWAIRFRNGKWLISFMSQLLIIVQMLVAGGHTIGLWSFQWSDAINLWVIGFVNTALVILALLGVIQDPTAEGYSDSQRALTYTKPSDNDTKAS